MDLVNSNWRAVPDFYQRELASVSRGYFRAMIFWLVVGLIAALSYAVQFIEGWGETLIPPSAVHSVGRLRMAHASIMIYGVLVNAFLGALSATCSPPDRGEGGGRGAGFLGFWILQFALLGGVLGLLYGEARAIPFFEMPVWANGFLLVGWLFAMGSMIGSVDSSEDEYARGVFPWMAVAFISGLGILAGAAGIQYATLPQDFAVRWVVAFQSGLFHLLLIPLGLAATQYFMRYRLPHGSWNRWWQGLLAVLLAGAGVLAGREAFELEPLPSGLTLAAFVLGCVYFGVLLLLAAGFALALRNALEERLEPPPWNSRSVIWFAAGWVALIVYLVQRFTILLGPEFVEAVQFTDWVVGHHHLILFLGLGAWSFGVLDELWPELRRCERWRMPLLADLHLALTLGGGWAMVVSLFVAGWAQSGLTRAMAPWSEVIGQSEPFWMVRVVSGSAITLGQVFLLLNVMATRDRTLPELRKPKPERRVDPEDLTRDLLDAEAEGFLR